MTRESRPRATGSITFIHTADWQLGKPFAGIADPAKRARVQQERLEAIRRIAAVVAERQARFVVVSGDLFDSPTPTRTTIVAALGAIAAIGVPVFAIPGNHDHGGPDSLWEQPFFQRERARLAPDFHVLGSAAATLVGLRDRGSGGATVALLSCPLRRRREADDPTAWIRDFDFAELGDAPRIVIAHGSTVAFTAGAAAQRDEDDETGGPANTIAIDRLPLDEIDYVALGDWHGFTAAGPKAFYSGTPEIDRFPKSGQEPGHVACVTVGRGAPPTVAAVRTGRFRWIAHHASFDAALDAGPRRTAAAGAVAASKAETAATGEVGGIARLDDWLADATRSTSASEPGFDGCLVRLSLSGTVSLADRAALDRIIESWEARLLRLDLTDDVRIAPTADEINDLAVRPDDPIIGRVAAELIRRLQSAVPGTGAGASTGADDPDVIRRALHMLHALAHPERSVTNLPTPTPGARSA